MELDEEETKKIKYNAHWQLSSSLTTQHLVCTVAVTNTLMGMNYVSFNQQEHESKGIWQSFILNFWYRQLQIFLKEGILRKLSKAILLENLETAAGNRCLNQMIFAKFVSLYLFQWITIGILQVLLFRARQFFNFSIRKLYLNK